MNMLDRLHLGHERSRKLGNTEARGWPIEHDVTAAQDDESRADLEDVAQAVRDVDDAMALRGEPAQEIVQAVGFVLAERAGRLVEQQHMQVRGERARQVHDLLLAEG